MLKRSLYELLILNHIIYHLIIYIITDLFCTQPDCRLMTSCDVAADDVDHFRVAMFVRYIKMN